MYTQIGHYESSDEEELIDELRQEVASRSFDGLESDQVKKRIIYFHHSL